MRCHSSPPFNRLQVLEEAGLQLAAPQFAYAVNSVFPSGAHYVTVFVRAEVPADAQPLNCEPHKCEGWEWVSRCRLGRQRQGGGEVRSGGSM